jgi:hypothetical protein
MMHDEEEENDSPVIEEAGDRIFIPLSESELWTLINLLGASAGTFDYVAGSAMAQGESSTAETFFARAQLARLFQARLGKLLATKYKDTQKH